MGPGRNRTRDPDDNDKDHYALSKNAEFLEHHFSHACDDNDDDHYALSNNAEFWEHHFSHPAATNSQTSRCTVHKK